MTERVIASSIGAIVGITPSLRKQLRDEVTAFNKTLSNNCGSITRVIALLVPAEGWTRSEAPCGRQSVSDRNRPKSRTLIRTE